MKRKIICIGSGLLVAALLLIAWEYGNRDKIKINKIAGVLHEKSISLKDYIESAGSRYEGSVIKVNIALKDAYEQLDVVQKFSVLDHFQKQMRYFMRNGQYATPLHSADLEIIAQSNDDMYYLTNTIPQNESFTKGESAFYVNKKKVYTSHMFKQYINAKSAGNPEEEREMNILNYSTHFFNVLTQFGKYYNPEIDSQIILDAVCDKFGLTFEEYDRIYQKHYIGNKDASLF